MQQRLFEPERTQPRLSKYVCFRCTLEPNNIPEGVQARYAGRKLHPILEQVCLTLLRCPKCKTQFYTREFFNR